MATQPETQVEDYGVGGCLAWSRYSHLKQGGVPAILKHFVTFCQSEGFIRHCTMLGFTNPHFYPNAKSRTIVDGNSSIRNTLSTDNVGYHKFSKCLTVSGNEKESTISDDACLGLVFYGTAQSNIDSILQMGLEKSRRRGQAYGPGEYFSKDPTVSIGYCKGGLEMLVFVVVLPPTLGRKNTNSPADYVVVENNSHHLAVGVLKFQAVDTKVSQLSRQRRSQFIDLNNKVIAKSQIKQETALKAKIIQHIIAGEVDVAAELYKKSSVLCSLSKQEISWYVHQTLDDEIIEWYFPAIPDPMKIGEINEKKVQHLDDAELEERKAKKELEDAQKAIFGNWSSTSAIFAMGNAPLAVPVNPAYTNTATIAAKQAEAAHLTLAFSSQSGFTTKQAGLPKSIVLDTPTQICKHLVANRVDIASELYCKNATSLDPTSKKEICDLASRFLDASLLGILFPGLPQASP